MSDEGIQHLFRMVQGTMQDNGRQQETLTANVASTNAATRKDAVKSELVDETDTMQRAISILPRGKVKQASILQSLKLGESENLENVRVGRRSERRHAGFDGDASTIVSFC